MRLPLATTLLLVTGLAALAAGQGMGPRAEQRAEQGAGQGAGQETGNSTKQGAGQAHDVSTMEATPRNTGGNQVGLVCG